LLDSEQNQDRGVDGPKHGEREMAGKVCLHARDALAEVVPKFQG
jgi:hypothetical protein